MELITETQGRPYNYNKHNVNIRNIIPSSGITIKKVNHQFVNSEYNKMIIQFDSNGDDDLSIRFKFSINQLFPDTLLVFVTLVSGSIEIGFNHNILNYDTQHTIFLTNIDMNNKKNRELSHTN